MVMEKIRNKRFIKASINLLSALKARTILGWKLEFRRDRGLVEILEWYRAFWGI